MPRWSPPAPGMGRSAPPAGFSPPWRFNPLVFAPQAGGEQLDSAAACPPASALPAALHALRSGEGEGGRRVLGVRPPAQQAARPGAAGLPRSPAVGHTPEYGAPRWWWGVMSVTSSVLSF